MLQMAEALFVIMNWTLLDASENSFKSYSLWWRDGQTFRRQEACLHTENHKRGDRQQGQSQRGL